MGSPLGPAFANLFLCHHEERWLLRCPETFKHIHYNRYVDDTFLTFRNKSHKKLFLQFLGSQLPNIKFTFETESHGTATFSDCLSVHKANLRHQFETPIIRKHTFSNFCTGFSVTATSISILLLKIYQM